MRFNGKLKVWHEDRGFGFIEPLDGGQDIFIHATTLPRSRAPPRVGELLSFEIELNRDGKKRATRVERPEPSLASGITGPAHANARRHPRAPTAERGSGLGLLGRLVGLAVVAALGFGGYREFQKRVPPAAGEPAASLLATPTAPAPPPALPSFRCDGRQHCSQMSSCAEAKFFLANCPNTKMDGDHDGIPCEDQHCKPA